MAFAPGVSNANTSSLASGLPLDAELMDLLGGFVEHTGDKELDQSFAVPSAAPHALARSLSSSSASSSTDSELFSSWSASSSAASTPPPALAVDPAYDASNQAKSSLGFSDTSTDDDVTLPFNQPLADETRRFSASVSPAPKFVNTSDFCGGAALMHKTQLHTLSQQAVNAALYPHRQVHAAVGYPRQMSCISSADERGQLLQQDMAAHALQCQLADRSVQRTQPGYSQQQQMIAYRMQPPQAPHPPRASYLPHASYPPHALYPPHTSYQPNVESYSAPPGYNYGYHAQSWHMSDGALQYHHASPPPLQCAPAPYVMRPGYVQDTHRLEMHGGHELAAYPHPVQSHGAHPHAVDERTEPPLVTRNRAHRAFTRLSPGHSRSNLPYPAYPPAVQQQRQPHQQLRQLSGDPPQHHAAHPHMHEQPHPDGAHRTIHEHPGYATPYERPAAARRQSTPTKKSHKAEATPPKRTSSLPQRYQAIGGHLHLQELQSQLARRRSELTVSLQVPEQKRSHATVPSVLANPARHVNDVQPGIIKQLREQEMAVGLTPGPLRELMARHGFASIGVSNSCWDDHLRPSNPALEAEAAKWKAEAAAAVLPPPLSVAEPKVEAAPDPALTLSVATKLEPILEERDWSLFRSPWVAEGPSTLCFPGQAE